jgi:hypothetical protein
MPPIATFAVLIFVAGAAFGYTVRAIISRRRHVEARRRYEENGSFWPLK